MKKIILLLVLSFFLVTACGVVEDSGSTEVTKEVAREDAGDYSMEVFDKLQRECNVACCGEETPVSCSDECRWPGYIDCFHGCMDAEGSFNCDAECWPEHKAYLDEKMDECK